MKPFQARATFATGLTVAALALTGCGPSPGELNQLASRGDVDRTAPVLAHVQVEIAARPAKVWAVLVNARAWPKWDQAIAKVSVTEPLANGTRFTWGEGSSTIHSQVQLFEPERRLAWTGTAFTAKAIHAWKLEPEPGDHTLVTIDESMDGPLMATLFSSEKLATADQEWLASLKHAAEQQ